MCDEIIQSLIFEFQYADETCKNIYFFFNIFFFCFIKLNVSLFFFKLIVICRNIEELLKSSIPGIIFEENDDDLNDEMDVDIDMIDDSMFYL